MKLISGSAHPSLARDIASGLGAEQLDVEISYFANGEKRIWIKGDVTGQNVVLVQSLSKPVDEHVMEILLLTDALERMGARHINLVMPWMGYSLQDKVFRAGEPIAAKVVADLVSSTHIKRAFLLDLHNSSTPGFFNIPTEHLTALQLFVKDAQEKYLTQGSCVVASPDFGGLKRARTFAEKLGVELVNIDKHRHLTSGDITSMGLHGEVEGKTVLIFDDVINSGGTVTSAAQVLKDHGADRVVFYSTHGIFANDGHTTIQNSPVDEVVVSDSIYQGEQLPAKLRTISVAPLFAEALAKWR